MNSLTGYYDAPIGYAMGTYGTYGDAISNEQSVDCLKDSNSVCNQKGSSFADNKYEGFLDRYKNINTTNPVLRNKF
jgi:hypothetical protein